MSDVFKSATKIVFLLVALTASIGFFLDKVTNEQYVGIVMMVFAFYYSNKNTPEVSSTKIL